MCPLATRDAGARETFSNFVFNIPIVPIKIAANHGPQLLFFLAVLTS
jgi:hypothetical protein